MFSRKCATYCSPSGGRLPYRQLSCDKAIFHHFSAFPFPHALLVIYTEKNKNFGFFNQLFRFDLLLQVQQHAIDRFRVRHLGASEYTLVQLSSEAFPQPEKPFFRIRFKEVPTIHSSFGDPLYNPCTGAIGRKIPSDMIREDDTSIFRTTDHLRPERSLQGTPGRRKVS
jgi:hypothetical protein